MSLSDADIARLTSSAQIFAANHTLPQIRAIHKALHVQIDDKAARLRSQVGGSYRELLGAADTIVQMRADMDAVQGALAGMGQRCGRAVVGGKVAALAALTEHQGQGQATTTTTTLRLAARARLLAACTRTAGRLLARVAGQQGSGPGPGPRTWGERLVLAAKVLVLGRLLVSGEAAAAAGDVDKEANEATAALHASIAASKKSLGHLRRRLQAIVELVVRAGPAATSSKGTAASAAASASAARDDLLQALCAHSLTTTSGVRDVLWHLLHVRGQAMAQALGGEEEEDDDDDDNDNERKHPPTPPDRILRGLALYTRTLLDVQALVPHRLPDALLALKRRPLLADDALRGLEPLRLDVYARWAAGDDMLHFRPYLRHDDLDGAQARAMLDQWAERGAQVLLDGVRHALEGEQQQHLGLGLESIVALRTRLLRRWLRDGSRVRGMDPTALLDRLRAVLNAQLERVLAAKAAKLRLVGEEVGGGLQGEVQRNVSEVKETTSLWSPPDKDGALSLVRDVVARLHGRSDAVARAAAAYATWRRVVDDAAAVLEQLRRQRWDTDVDDENGNGDNNNDNNINNTDSLVVEDEDTLAARQQRLGRDDPAALLAHLRTAVATAVRALDARLTEVWRTAAAAAAADQDTAAAKGRAAAYLVRVLREMRRAPPVVLVDDTTATTTTTTTTTTLGLGIIPDLHAALAAAVVAAPLAQLAATVLVPARTSTTVVAGRVLWEAAAEEEEDASGGVGVALPTAPSPGVFQFLRTLSLAMGRAGTDLWSPTAVAELKRQVVAGVGEQWAAAAVVDDEMERKKDLLLQWLFDLAWLRCALVQGNDDDDDALAVVADKVYEQLALDDDNDTTRARTTASAQASWKKTRLLFGLL